MFIVELMLLLPVLGIWFTILLAAVLTMLLGLFFRGVIYELLTQMRLWNSLTATACDCLFGGILVYCGGIWAISGAGGLICFAGR